MTAVDPSRLQKQIDALLSFFEFPEKFHKSLQDFFILYAYGSLHYGEGIKQTPTTPTYHLPAPLIRQLKNNIKPFIKGNPAAALTLADELWTDEYLEIKTLAIYILKNLPETNPNVLLSRIEDWLDPNFDVQFNTQILAIGKNKLLNSFPSEWENLIQGLISKNDPKFKSIGILGLQESLNNSEFENFPLVFRLVSPLVLNPQIEIMNELETLLTNMITKSPTEAAFFLRQTLSISQSPETSRLVKKCLHAFPVDIRQDVKSILK